MHNGLNSGIFCDGILQTVHTIFTGTSPTLIIFNNAAYLSSKQ